MSSFCLWSRHRVVTYVHLFLNPIKYYKINAANNNYNQVDAANEPIMDSKHRKKTVIPQTTIDQKKQIADNDKLQRKLGVHIEHKKKRGGSKTTTKVKHTKKGRKNKGTLRTSRSRNHTVSGPTGFGTQFEARSPSPHSHSQYSSSNNNNNNNTQSFSPQPQQRQRRRQRGKSTTTLIDLQSSKPRSVKLNS